MQKSVHLYDRLHVESLLPQNLLLMSKNQAYFAFISPAGQLHVYVSGHFVPSNLLWTSNNKQENNPPFFLQIKKDGNMVIFDSKEAIIWESKTGMQGKFPFQLIMQDDGNLVLYEASGRAIWCAGDIDR